MNIVWPESRWILPAAIGFVLLALLVTWNYARAAAPFPTWARWTAGGLKIAGFALLLLFLLDPQFIRTVSKPGANALALLADDSASLRIADQPGGRTRGDALREILADPAWQQPLAGQFETRRYAFARAARRTEDFQSLTFEGPESALQGALARVAQGAGAAPLTAILVFTDGAATDFAAPRPEGLPPVYPVLIESGAGLVDASVERATATTSVFESAPVTVDAAVRCLGAADQPVTIRLLDADGREVAREQRTPRTADETVGVRFLTSPKEPGPAAYRVEVALAGDAIPQNDAATVVANRETGPRRVLYAAGQPNWEHKFLQRALADDPEVKLVSLLRIARGAARFDWQSADGTRRANPLYQGQNEEAERYDEPVFLRLGARDAGELRAGFPRTEAELFAYDAIILDNLEAAFFTADQLALLRKFVADRGGSLLLLGGADSLDAGGYARTPLAGLLPVYLGDGDAVAPAVPVRVDLTREGLLQPWMRLRANERDEAARLAAMPGYLVAHGLPKLKPGAEALATLTDQAGKIFPAIVSQRFGRGRATVFLVGDWWRWGMRGPDERLDLEKFWRQAVRGLLADAPRRADLAPRIAENGTIELVVTALGPDFRPAEKASATLRVRNPAGEWANVNLEPDAEQPGRFIARPGGRQSGAWRAEAVITDAADGATSRAETGWAVNRDADEFRSPRADPAALAALAQATGGRVIRPNELKALLAEIEARPQPIRETLSVPLWHHAGWLALAMACFVGEWSLRRWKGLA